MFFFARANQTLKACVKTYINHFHGNHFWTPLKSFSCAVNHFLTSRKWFLTHVNDYFLQKTARNVFFVAVNDLLKMIFKWKSFFGTGKTSFPFGNDLHFLITTIKFWHASRLCGDVSKFLQTESSCEKHHLCSIFVVTFSLILVKKSFSKYEEIISNYSNFNILYKPFPTFRKSFPRELQKWFRTFWKWSFPVLKKWFPFGNHF